MPKVKALKKFYDVEAKLDREPGDSWDVTAERATALNSTQYGELVEVAKAARRKPAAKKGDAE